MLRSIRALSSGAFLTLLFVAVQVHAAEKVLDKRFPATPGGLLEVETDMGAIIVTGSDSREVVVHAVISGSESHLRDFELSAEPTSRGVSVRGRRLNDWWLDLSWFFGGDTRGKFEIQVPREYRLDLRTSGGAIEAQNIQGDVRGHTSGGHLRLNSIKGEIDMHTSGGSIQGERLDGNAQLRTSGGTITIRDTSGQLDARTSGGSVRLENIDGEINARTSGGSMDVSLRGGNRGVTLRTSGGSIRLAVPRDIKATLDAHSSGGRVSSDLPVTTTRHGDDDRNELRGDINGGGPMISARTSGGSISVRARD